MIIGEFRRVDSQVAELTLVTQPLATDASALEVSALGTGAAVLRYLADPTRDSRDAIALRIAETMQDLERLTTLGGPALQPLARALPGTLPRAGQQRRPAGRLARARSGAVRDFAGSLSLFDRYLDDELPRLDAQTTDRIAFQARLVTLRSELVRVVGRMSAQSARPACTAPIPRCRRCSARASCCSTRRRAAPTPRSRRGCAASAARWGGSRRSPPRRPSCARQLREEADRFGTLRDATADLLANEMHELVNARVASIDAEVRTAIASGNRLAIGFAIALALASAALLALFNRQVVRPLASLAAGAARVGAGDFATAVPFSAARDEIGRLVTAFNAMMARVSATQRALTDHAATLDDAVRARTADLEQANAALREAVGAADRANAAKSAFLAAMSHELRTPLNAIIGFSEVIAGQLLGPNKEDRYRGYAARHPRQRPASARHRQRPARHGEDRGRQARAQPRGGRDRGSGRGDRRDAAAAASSSRRWPAPWRSTSMPARSRGDRRIIKQVLLNLLANAIKFTPSGGRIAVTAQRAGDVVAIAVADSGIGMTGDEVAQAAEPFYQADGSLARKYEGTGLGLTLVKAFVERHAGTFVITSQPGVGTTVTVRLPIAPAASLIQAAD